MKALTSTWPMSGTLLTPAQCRHTANQLRLHGGKRGWPERAEAEEMARRHEGLARMIEQRLMAARDSQPRPIKE